MNNILLVEDNETLGYILKEYLEMKDFGVELARDGKAGLKAFKKRAYDLCILDVMMPEMDGFTLAGELRAIEAGVPIIFLTAKALKVDKLKGFNLGADDYIVKPVDEEELLARIKAILRRSKGNTSPQKQSYEVGAYHFDFSNQKLVLDEEEQILTEREAQLLRLLCENKGKLLSRRQVLNTLWNTNDYFTRRSMDVFISRLRKYLAKDPLIKINNVYGSGFILTDTEEG
ncbi:response regulator transcription factor [Flavilitoribacter nigricans]|uniref:DNA-binding response regulator n=1 Tax=Flavilitoribacter nigricans (strain ATCC 23147 / DSM 23189 / NBRC 102662 / NCIMB 1420 / SS-2) TaxID=1122177 RepID=A0A2D0ND45_FLAN2|nr:response regulator transcription factor [Flavilitoribacter nigricans]PHN06431.1 DNA-binding response regulator [Flavilitoribacter nigricans DSM 23189 = NBRC 102662]